jgi:uncharacterized protein (DUF488 family)
VETPHPPDDADGGTARTPPSAELWTLGHSTHPVPLFLALLRSFRIARVVDVRTDPRSRHNPQFDRTALPATLTAAGIAYTHRADLGGLRRPSPQSVNTAWRNASFRAFADYMQSDAFAAAVTWLAEAASHERIALLCAEQLPWRCHRSLISDALVVRGLRVCHIMKEHECLPHRLTGWAHVEGWRITYPGAAERGEPEPL